MEATLDTPTSTQASQPPAIGEYWPGQGGIYCGILPAFDGYPARHLIASDQDAPSCLTWGPYGEEIEGASSRTDGRANTAALLAAKAATGESFPAAEWASQHQADGHSDFHLPSQAELFMASLYAPKAFGQSSWYWSSTQLSASRAFAQTVEYGDSYWCLKDDGFRVRAVRWIPL